MRKYRYLSFLLMTASLNMLPLGDINHTENLIDQEIEGTQKNQEKDYEINYWHKTKSLVNAPVDYVFGQESSRTKTIFYVVFGAVVVVVGAYGSYHYLINVLNQKKELENKTKELEDKIKEHKNQVQLQSEDLEKLKLAQRNAADLKLYRSMVADRINVESDLNGARYRLRELGNVWNSGNISKALASCGGIANYNKQQDELLSKISNLDKKLVQLKQQESKFRCDHEYISPEQFKEVENAAQGVCNRWGKSIIS